MDVIKGPGKAPALSSAEVMGDFPIKPWEDGENGEGGRDMRCVRSISGVWQSLLSHVADAGCLGYTVGVNPAPQNKYIIQHLMRLANREGMTQWGRMTLALVCDRKTVQVLVYSLWGRGSVGRG